jgi:hypothetical protein
MGTIAKSSRAFTNEDKDKNLDREKSEAKAKAEAWFEVLVEF